MVSKKDKLLAVAQKYLERGNLDKALAEFEKAVQEDPKDTRTWLRIAELQVKRGDNDKATQVYLKTADLYVEQGFFQRAVAVYKNIVKLSPNFVDAYSKLADIYKQLGLLSDAVQQYDQVAQAYQRAGRSKEALAAMRQIVELNPEQAVSHIKLAEAAAQAGLVDESVAEFTKAADLLKAQGRVDEFLRVAERLLAHRPDDVALAKQIAVQYIERNNARFALAKLQACFKVDPRDTETLDLLARAFEQLGQTAKTIAVLKELARVYTDAGRINERNFTLQRILSIDSSDAEAREMMTARPPQEGPGPVRSVREMGAQRPQSRLRDSLTFTGIPIPPPAAEQARTPPISPPAGPGSTADRVAIASSMLERTPQEAAGDIQRILAEADVFVKYGLVDRAIEHLRKVFESTPSHAGAHERLAALLAQAGRKAEAVVELEALASIAAPNDEVAAGYARRALALDPGAKTAAAIIARIEGRGAGPATRPPPPVAMAASATATAAALARGPEESFPGAGSPDATPEPMALDSDEFTVLSPGDGGTVVTAMPLAPDGPSARQTRPEGTAEEFDVVVSTGSNNPGLAALLEDLEQVDFFLDQGLPDEAAALLDDLDVRHAGNSLLQDRRARLAGLLGFADVPHTTAGGAPDGFAAPSPTAVTANPIAPRAMVASGGVADVTTHRDLGIAYKEMGLADAAIKEFNFLLGDAQHESFALMMIGECHEAKGEPGNAVAAYKRALNVPSVTEEEQINLYYQLGNAFEGLGDPKEALYFFEKVGKRDSQFKDVSARITSIHTRAAGSAASAPAAAVAAAPSAPPDDLDDAFDALFSGQTRSRR